MTTMNRDALSQEQFDTLLQFFQVFGNESRLKIIGYLANGDRNVGELAELLSLREPTISHHLAEMKALGLVTVRPEGTARIYHLDGRALERMSKDVFAQTNLAAMVGARDLSDDERILRTWVKDGRIIDFPAQEKKKLVIVRWVAGQIEPDRRWTEKEFSQWLAQFNEDYATLRRYLVDLGYVVRENGVYWRAQQAGEA